MNKNIADGCKKVSVVLLVLIALCGAMQAAAQTITNSPTAPTWNALATDSLLKPGISAATVGVISPTSPFIPTPPYLGDLDGDHVFKLYDTSNIAYPTPPSTGRPTVTPDEHHHHNWDMGSMGNVYGIAIDDDRNIYTTASTHYGAGYFTGAGVVGFGGIGDGQTPDTAALDNNTEVLNSTAAAGAVYKVDAVTGNVSVLANLPQQAYSFIHENCENAAETQPRNTGPALGNVEYDAINNQLFVSNFEDGRIYRLSMAGVVLSVFDPFAVDNGAAGLPTDAMPYGLAVNADASKLYFGTLDFANPTNPGIYAVDLAVDGDFTGSEIDQNADLTNDLNYSQTIGGGFTSNPWTSYSDLTFTPKGELMVGVRTGCGSTAPNLATSHNHGGTFYKLIQDSAGLYNAAAPGTVGSDGNFPVHYIGDTLGPDDGYGGVAIFDKGDGTFDYLTTSADISVEEGPHGFLVFPHNYTVGDNVSTYFIAQGASIAGLPSTNPPAGVADYKGVFGDIEVLGTLLDWGDAPDSYNTDNIPPDPSDPADLAGPSHILTEENITIGSVVDFESSGVPSVDATGDDTSGSTPDDEDGITGTPTFSGGDTAVFNVPVNNPVGNPVVILYAWLDLNGDGDFGDPGEFVSSNSIAAGTSPTVNLNFGTVPNDSADTFIRLRITSDTLTASDYEGYASNGEVEDHPVRLNALTSLGSTVWLDSDLDGIQDSGEPPIQGVTATLLNADGTTYDSDTGMAGIQALVDTTDVNGEYNFNSLPEGDYRVQVDVSTATSHNPSLIVPSPVQVADPDAAGSGQDNNTDSNIDASVPGSSVGTNANDTATDSKYTSGVITLSDGEEPISETDPIGVSGADQPNQTLTASDDPDDDGNMTVDFGFIPPVSLGSTLWLDQDRDGIQETGELPIVGATVMLLNADGTLYDNDLNTVGIQSLSVNTDSNGQYNFDLLRVGDYRVKVDVSSAMIGAAVNAVNLLPTPIQVADPDAAGSGQNNNTDSNIDLSVPGTVIGAAVGDTGIDDIYTSGVISLSSGGEPTGEIDPIGTPGTDQPNQNATLDPDSSGNMTVDFGFVQAVSLGSTIWFDNDADGIQETSEPGISGAVITLLNDDGTVYDSDPATLGVQALTDTTDADGQYNFDGLPQGDYRVQVNLTTAVGYTAGTLSATAVQVADPDAAGPGQDNNTDSNVDSSAPGHNPAANIFQSGIVTLTVGGEPVGETDPVGTPGADQPNQGTDDPDANGNMTVDMGFIQLVSLGSTVWQDNDADGTQDATEPAIMGATVTLLNANGTVYDSDLMTAGVQGLMDVTDGDGQYNFNNLLPGDYRVQVNLATVTNGADLLPSPIQVADPDAAGSGQNNNNDSNIDFAFDANTADLIHTSGIVSLTPGLEPTGEVDPIGTGANASTPDQPNQGLTPTNQPDNAGNMTVDFGFVKPVSLGSTIWKDNDVDGIQDAAEPGIVGATVTLLNADGTEYDSNPYIAGIQSLTDTTDADGQYNFNDLVSGNYRVKVDLAMATNVNANSFIPSLVQVPDPDAAGPGQDNNTDSNIDEPFDSNTTDQIHTSGVITLSVGDEPTGETDPIGAGANASTPDQPNQGLTAANQPDANGNMTVDFGFIEPVSLGSTVWFDSDADGAQDAAEPAIAGATVTLLNANGTVYDADPVTAGIQSVTDVTDASGLYNFNGLPEGDYRVQVDLNTATSHTGGALQATPTQVADPDAAGPGQDNNTDSNVDSTAPGHNPAGNIYQSGVVTLSVGGEPAGETDTITGGSDQPNQTTAQPDTNGNMTVDFGFIQPVSLGSTIWQDLNGNGTQDSAEPGIMGATITLLNADGTVFDSDPNTAGIQSLTDTTDADGQYNFDGLPPGDYRVQVDLSTVTSGGDLFPSPVQVADPDAAGLGQDNNTDSNVDFGFDTNLNDQVHTSGVVTLASGLEPTGEADPIGAGANLSTPDQPNQGLTATDDPDNSGNMTVDMAFVKPVSIGSTVWQDSNGDGTQDDNELVITGSTVTLLNGDGTVFDSDPYTAGVQALVDITDVEGQYNFNDLPPGDYRVQVDLSSVSGGSNFIPTLTQVADPDGDDNTDSNIDVMAPGHSPLTSVYQSGVVTLTAGGEPTLEVDPIDGVNNNGDVADQPNQSVVSPDNSGNMTVDFGFIVPVSVGSVVWDDLDGDGLQDANEPALANAVVSLLVDDGAGNFIPVTDVDGNPVTSMTTGPDGMYLFDNLLPGDYKVQVTPPAGYYPSGVQNAVDNDDTENDSNIAGEPTLGTFESGVFTLESGNEPIEGSERGDDQDDSASAVDLSGNMTVDFGFTRPASIGDTVWVDLDMDGIQDANEDPLVGVTVILTPPATVDLGNGPGVSIMTTTDANGNYLFPDLPPFSDPDPSVGYVVMVDPATLPVGYAQTYDEGDGVGATDHTSDPIQLTPEEFHDTADFGYVPDDGAIGDTIWIDADGDGVQDPGEQGIPNVTVTLTPAPDVDLGNGLGVPITTMTDANGKYLFPNLPLDEAYIVTVDETTLPVGYTSDPDGDGDPDVRDGNATTADGVTVITLTSDAPVNLDADFGYLPPEDQNNSVGDTVWLDTDGDGTQNNGEVGIAGVTIDLIDQATGAVVASTVTDANGNYLFLGVPDGLYEVTVTDTNNVLSTLDQTFDSDDPANPGAFVAVTSNVSVVDLDSAGTSDTPVEDLNQDFGYNNSSGNPGTIGDTVFFDADGDGAPDVGEGLQGVVVELYDSNGNLIGSTTTDSNGNYLFNDLPVSATGETYMVVIDTSTLPNGGTGWTNSVDPNGGNDSTSSVTLTDTAPVDLEQDFGYEGEGDNAIEGTVWSDSDGDGMQEEGGTFEGVTIELRDQNGNVIATTTTDANGDYEFTGLPDGIYTVVVTDDNNILSNYQHTDSPNGSSDTGDNTSKDDQGYTVDLDSSGSSTDPVIDNTGDFGYMPVVTNPISLASFIAERVGSKVQFTWTTQTEVSNLGFHLYAQVNGSWQRLNDSLVQGQGDSVSLRSYDASYEIKASYFAISDIDIYGKETLHGPFKLGESVGTVVQTKPIDWSASKSTNVLELERQRQVQKIRQMKQRNQQRNAQ